MCAINAFCNLILMHLQFQFSLFSLQTFLLFFLLMNILFAASFSYSLIILIWVTLLYCKLKYIFSCLLCTLPAFLLLFFFFFAFLLPSNLVESPFRDAICHTFHVKVTAVHDAWVESWHKKSCEKAFMFSIFHISIHKQSPFLSFL